MRRSPIPPVLAAGALGASLGFMLSDSIRSSSPIYHTLGNVAFLWHIILMVGALLAFYGNWRRQTWLEALGLVWISTGILVYVIAVASTRGLASWTAAWLLGASGLAHIARARELRHGGTKA